MLLDHEILSRERETALKKLEEEIAQKNAAVFHAIKASLEAKQLMETSELSTNVRWALMMHSTRLENEAIIIADQTVNLFKQMTEIE